MAFKGVVISVQTSSGNGSLNSQNFSDQYSFSFAYDHPDE